MGYEDTLYTCSTKDCTILSLIWGFFLLIIILSITIYIYKMLLKHAKKEFNIQNNIIS